MNAPSNIDCSLDLKKKKFNLRCWKLQVQGMPCIFGFFLKANCLWVKMPVGNTLFLWHHNNRGQPTTTHITWWGVANSDRIPDRMHIVLHSFIYIIWFNGVDEYNTVPCCTLKTIMLAVPIDGDRKHWWSAGRTWKGLLLGQGINFMADRSPFKKWFLETVRRNLPSLKNNRRNRKKQRFNGKAHIQILIIVTMLRVVMNK